MDTPLDSHASTIRVRYETSPLNMSRYAYAAGILRYVIMLGEGEFDIQIRDDGVEVWVTQMGNYMNMNTAWVNRSTGTVAITDPFDSKRWVSALKKEGLRPTHLLYTHTHRDHVEGYADMIELIPEIEVWGHSDANLSGLLAYAVFKKVNFTNEWNNGPNTTIEWSVGGISLSVTHSPGHAPGHVTIHGHGVYHAGDLLFTAHSGRVDLPGSDPGAQWDSVLYARNLLRNLPRNWRLIPGHRYDWIDGTTPDWVSIEDALEHNYSLNSPVLNSLGGD
ncbi:MAG TPA: MBL fold metallo-hydrolase [Candidatus Thalassarchaeaceae archaeon]|jgi:glyoxylase-like metal-dependent hydrolase (beta-lactamase superfamily II)|nr:MBL fold metallo-hydrolase [Euryarchaeota archaeon]MDG1547769.1 MBL fold metallo-hydrolase [Candidatus Thalassarchaeaceae archaeon]MDG1553586.1 MBL fold metallo-hydrolase [Candidatus Thalassarchaeaceae archaeon]DAC65425.1 MAG TPA: MBL fold metallo-hydrolase [Candidatus Poseidoniales archaeon]HIH05631.1 MBL fold metallo-hydrolase [Candidatus Thalassarchaeaceae archaeon]|tara:strand:- start:4790 stop:5620 length:831 start_codon:yes stop_codon:yes gene_type:complete